MDLQSAASNGLAVDVGASFTTAALEEGTVWLDATGRPNANARDALRLLADAGLTGQRPRRAS